MKYLIMVRELVFGMYSDNWIRLTGDLETAISFMKSYEKVNRYKNNEYIFLVIELEYQHVRYYNKKVEPIDYKITDRVSLFENCNVSFLYVYKQQRILFELSIKSESSILKIDLLKNESFSIPYNQTLDRFGISHTDEPQFLIDFLKKYFTVAEEIAPQYRKIETNSVLGPYNIDVENYIHNLFKRLFDSDPSNSEILYSTEL